jgi:hypothetical protein
LDAVLVGLQVSKRPVKKKPKSAQRRPRQ